MCNSSQNLNCGIYKIINIVNNKFYIGSAIKLKARWLQHKSYFKRNKHQNSVFQRAWNKYGEAAFSFEIIEYCAKENLISREQFWLDWFKPYDPNIGYNNRKIADSGLGTKRTPEQKARMSKAAKLRPPMSEEVKLKISKTKKGNCSLSEERKIKLKARLTGRIVSDETKAKIAKTLTGRKYSPERIAAMVAGRNYAPK